MHIVPVHGHSSGVPTRAHPRAPRVLVAAAICLAVVAAVPALGEVRHRARRPRLAPSPSTLTRHDATGSAGQRHAPRRSLGAGPPRRPAPPRSEAGPAVDDGSRPADRPRPWPRAPAGRPSSSRTCSRTTTRPTSPTRAGCSTARTQRRQRRPSAPSAVAPAYPTTPDLHAAQPPERHPQDLPGLRRRHGQRTPGGTAPARTTIANGTHTGYDIDGDAEHVQHRRARLHAGGLAPGLRDLRPLRRRRHHRRTPASRASPARRPSDTSATAPTC